MAVPCRVLLLFIAVSIFLYYSTFLSNTCRSLEEPVTEMCLSETVIEGGTTTDLKRQTAPSPGRVEQLLSAYPSCSVHRPIFFHTKKPQQ